MPLLKVEGRTRHWHSANVLWMRPCTWVHRSLLIISSTGRAGRKLESKVATVFWAGRKRQAVGTSTRTALSSGHNQIHSQLPGAGVQRARGPRHTRAKLPGLPGSRSTVVGCSANPTLRILLLDRSRRKVTRQGLMCLPLQADAALLDTWLCD